MKLSILKTILAHGEFVVSDYRIIGELFSAGEPTNSTWVKDFDIKHKAPPTSKNASTFDSCVRCHISTHVGKVIAELRIYDGDVRGVIERHRCTFTFEVKKVGAALSETAKWRLTELAERAVAQEDEDLYLARVKMAKQKLLQAA